MSRADAIIEQLGLQPLEPEGGFFRETYRSALSSAIYFLLTVDTFSAMHRLPGDEIFHFYRGDAVEMLLLPPGGAAEKVRAGANLVGGERPQVVVPGGTWQGSRLVDGGSYALFGTTMAPGFDFADYEAGDRAALVAEFPASAEHIWRLT